MAPNGTSTRKSQSLLYENEDIERLSFYEKNGYRTVPTFYVNGTLVPNSLACLARPNQTLLQFLRETLCFTGTKLGCAEGGCGACTVMLSKVVTSCTTENGTSAGATISNAEGDDTNHSNAKKVIHYSVNACLMPVLAADGCHITTIEGIGTVQKKTVHPIQQAMIDLHGSQCGFCTPGIIVSLYAHLLGSTRGTDKTASVQYMEEHLDGNLCRCTGYRPIWDAARVLCDDATDDTIIHGPCGTACRDCPERESCTQDCNEIDKQQQKPFEEKKEDTNNCCISSTKDKVVAYKKILTPLDKSWRSQPDDMFPSELLQMSEEMATKPLMVVDTTEFHAGGTWFKATTFLNMLQLLDEFAGNCKIVIGNTEVGIETRFKHSIYPRLLAPSDAITELYQFSVDTKNHSLTIGSCCPLSTIQKECGKWLSTSKDVDSGYQRTGGPMHDMLRWFASSQIRNVACLGGNLVTASPISDMNPMLACLGATLTLASILPHTTEIIRRVVPVASFFVKYRTVDLQPNEMVESINVPIVDSVFEYVKPFKQARRREDDISIVTSGMRLRLEVSSDGSKYVIKDICIAFGGMAPTTILPTKTLAALQGGEFCSNSFELASATLLKELTLPETVPGGQAAFRLTLATSFLYKFYLSVVQELGDDVEKIRSERQANPTAYPQLPTELPQPPVLDETETTGTTNFLTEKKPKYYGVQKYPKPRVAKGLEENESIKVKESNPDLVVVGKPSTHMSGPLHCTGEAIYNDDIPIPPGCLHAALVLSNQCGGILEAMDSAPALAIPGVVGVYTAVDVAAIGGNNQLGIIAKDEYVFLPIGELVPGVGHTLGIVVAETLESAELAARMVKVTYGPVEEGEKIVITIEDAIAANSFYDFSRHVLERGDLPLLSTMATTPDTTSKPQAGDVVKISGSFRSGAQEHFYLETNSTLVVPSEADTNLTIYASTQATGKTHNYCSSATGTPYHKVVVRVKRLGGGFGGKESRNVPGACAAAVAAKVSNRPVRLTFARDVDMKTTGTRHAFLSTYHASARVLDDGNVQLLSLDVKIYNNGGSAFDLSGPVMDRAMFHLDNCYNFPNYRVEGVSCKTAQPPHTAFRGFGGPQGMAVTEHVMDHLALVTGVSGDVLRRTNMYKDGDILPFGTVVGELTSGKWNVPTMWDRLYHELNVSDRRSQIAVFNSQNKWVKRGLALIPTKFGIAFTAKYMNQGGALVHCYQDGTVLISHGGTEMGQGLHTKVCQVAAQAFGIALEQVYVNDSSTDKVANSIPTAASMSTDMYGMATLDACRQIIVRLEPIREKLGPDASFKDIVGAAHLERIDLSAHGFFALNSVRCGYDWAKSKPDDWPVELPENTWKGQPFNYFTQGCAYAEVEIDLLTGNHKTTQVDLLVDVGSSINPMIDIGQVEGAFIQGMGWSTIEEVVYADDDHTWIRPRGVLFTTGPGTYKIPSFNDVPEIFNVSLIENVDNPFAVHSSKAVGEPPFFLGTAVFYAIKDAITAARKENLGVDSYFEMRMPATSERIRMYAGDKIAGNAVTMVKGISAADVASFQPQGSH